MEAPRFFVWLITAGCNMVVDIRNSARGSASVRV